MLRFGPTFSLQSSNKERDEQETPTDTVTTMTTHNAVQVTKKRKTVPSVRAPTDDKGSRATTTKTQKKPASQKKKQKTDKGGISKNRNKPDDVVENVQ